jgi:hypothetical protein
MARTQTPYATFPSRWTTKGAKKKPTAKVAAVANQLDKTLRAMCHKRNCKRDSFTPTLILDYGKIIDWYCRLQEIAKFEYGDQLLEF